LFLQEECLAELEGQMFDLRDKLAAAEEAASKASALESTVGATKDQYVRLQADFENFRKRTVREEGMDGCQAESATWDQ
jgi:molecular chaperone GrpE